ncbi:MAG: glycogen/starch/alpha-glucan phosphorylase [Acidobacteriaceae bacterium]
MSSAIALSGAEVNQQAVEAAVRAIRDHIQYDFGKRPEKASTFELFRAVGLAVRRPMIDRMQATEDRFQKHNAKRLYYLSMEFLVGQSLRNNLENLELWPVFEAAAKSIGVSLEHLVSVEPDAALGNGGLGRLAACFLDSLATLNMPGYGYGINYDFGLFRQRIDDGYQVEEPDHWLSEESPWIIPRPDQACVIPLYGRIQHGKDRKGNYNPMWMDWKLIVGVPHDLPIVGYGGNSVNYLRLFSARASAAFNIDIFNQGDYLKAVSDKIDSEKISKILYPGDSAAAGKELRLVQEYFLCACAIRDILRRHLDGHRGLDDFANHAAVQMNDTHPALAVAELMRLLVDEQHLEWDPAWEITQATCAYTNHTLMPEALEKWPLELFEKVLPRHLQVIHEINRRFLQRVTRKWPGPDERLEERMKELSIIDEGLGGKTVRMAHLAVVGSHAVNGVAKLHSDLVKTHLMPGFHELWPEKFQNKTNGVTHRRWLAYANPQLARLISRILGNSNEWLTNLALVRALEDHAEDPEIQREFRQIKQSNKQRLSDVSYQTTGLHLNKDSVFDVQIKRIHEYKRQLLHVMQIIHEYLALIEDGQSPAAPVTHIFAGKAAPGYTAAKLIIKLINNVAAVINNDDRARMYIRVVFLPDYRVSLAEQIIPAADISEQISTAGFEASGTGNMKLAMNGAVTLGTLDGANIEILQEAGVENIYIFGLSSIEVAQMRAMHDYAPQRYYAESSAVRRVVDALSGSLFCPGEPGLFRSIAEKVMSPGDPYFHLADLDSYIRAKQQMLADYNDAAAWTSKAMLNTARMAKFSSDRTVCEYANDIWDLKQFAE